MRHYLIICLKRSSWPEKKVYWRPNRAGYRESLYEAGFYEASDLELCAGSRGDWILEPIWKSVWIKAEEEE